MGHLGSRTSALLDGQLSPAETERAWEHVHSCHACRDLVEREGWVKTRLAGLSFEVAAPSTPDWLKGSLMGAPDSGAPGDVYLQPADHRRRNAGMVAIGSGAVGAAVMGVLVFGVAPADAPTIHRPAPASITQSGTPSAPAPSQPVALTRGANARR